MHVKRQPNVSFCSQIFNKQFFFQFVINPHNWHKFLCWTHNSRNDHSLINSHLFMIHFLFLPLKIHKSLLLDFAIFSGKRGILIGFFKSIFQVKETSHIHNAGQNSTHTNKPNFLKLNCTRVSLLSWAEESHKGKGKQMSPNIHFPTFFQPREPYHIAPLIRKKFLHSRRHETFILLGGFFVHCHFTDHFQKPAKSESIKYHHILKYKYLTLHMRQPKYKPMLIVPKINSFNLSHLGPFNTQENTNSLSREELVQKWDQWLRKDEWMLWRAAWLNENWVIWLSPEILGSWAAESRWKEWGQLGHRGRNIPPEFGHLSWGSCGVTGASVFRVSTEGSTLCADVTDSGSVLHS